MNQITFADLFFSSCSNCFIMERGFGHRLKKVMLAQSASSSSAFVPLCTAAFHAFFISA